MQLLAYCIGTEWTDSNNETPLIRLDPWAEFKKQAAWFLSNSVHVYVSTIYRIGLVYTQARIETE
jgi:hypothetical protein